MKSYCQFRRFLARTFRPVAVYQFRKGISAGPALKYLTSFIGAGARDDDLLARGNRSTDRNRSGGWRTDQQIEQIESARLRYTRRLEKRTKLNPDFFGFFGDSLTSQAGGAGP